MSKSEDGVAAGTRQKNSSRLDEESADDSDDQDEMEDTDSDDQMAFNDQVIEESLKKFQEGDVVRGKIIKIDNENVLVDIGYKSEGLVSIDEFLDQDGNVTAQIGDYVDVLLEQTEDEEGGILLSKEKANKIKVWDEISRVYNEDGVITGIITSKVKGGLSVDIGIPAFLPGSQVDLRPVRNLDAMVGKSYDFKILKFNKKRGNIVLSRRAILEQEKEQLKTRTISNLAEEQVVTGTVKNITEYGVFVDLGGIDGLLHITDISWGRVGHPSEMFSIGDEIKVKVLNFDRDRERVSLGLKQLAPDPWTTADEKYPVGTKVTGKVVSLAKYGSFIEIEEGIEGLIHVSEMSWTRKIHDPSKVVSIGDVVEAVVLNIDSKNKRISLGMKQVEPNPWDVIGEKYPVGTVIQGRIKNITDFGIFIGIEEGIDGLVHISDISWTKRIKHPSELYRKGQDVKAIVLNIDRENERFSLGIKQLTPDPWEDVPRKYPINSKVTGTITNVTDFGVFVEIEEGIEGLVHVSEASKDKLKSPVGHFNSGDLVTAKVISVSNKERKIGLSIKRLEEDDEKSIYQDYLTGQKAATSNVGQLIKEGLELAEQKKLENETADKPEVKAE
ncbi:MAG: 30S ribosomal protein S1 [Deltaproteobacteria bacterium]|nr:30S ribosomal protein S1 [Deltaproteobacteria bacterium]